MNSIELEYLQMDEKYTSYETLFVPSERVLMRSKWKYKEIWPLRWRKGMSQSHRRKCLRELRLPQDGDRSDG